MGQKSDLRDAIEILRLEFTKKLFEVVIENLVEERDRPDEMRTAVELIKILYGDD